MVHHMTMTDERRPFASQAPDDRTASDDPAVTPDELSAHLIELIDRVRAGETIALVSERFASIKPDGPAERKMAEFVAKGYVRPDWRRRHEELLELINEGPVPPIFDDGRTATEELLRERAEDQR